MSTAVGAVSGEADGQLLSSTVTGDRRNRGDVEKGETVWDERTGVYPHHLATAGCIRRYVS